MPKRTDIKRVLVIGSGPIVIGQACEFDYSGTQACKALRAEGLEVVLVNSNPATIMTDPEIADRTYVEPLTAEMVAEIIERERPDALLPTVGGQTALNLAVALGEERHARQVQRRADRRVGRRDQGGRGSAAVPRRHARDRRRRARAAATSASLKEAFAAVDDDRLSDHHPAVVHAGRRRRRHRLQHRGVPRDCRRAASSLSPVHEVLLEESVIGWKEFELEVMRDRADNFVVICSIENVDPMGVHTGDSITVAPALTLTDKEYQRMRDLGAPDHPPRRRRDRRLEHPVRDQSRRRPDHRHRDEPARLAILGARVEGDRVSDREDRRQARARLHLDEIPNDITRLTPASFEPTIDYVVVKVPRWAFEKFPRADRTLTTQMKSVGEVMAIGRTFKEAFMKAFRSLELGASGLLFGQSRGRIDATRLTDEEEDEGALQRELSVPTDRRMWALFRALDRGWTVEDIHELTKIDPLVPHPVLSSSSSCSSRRRWSGLRGISQRHAAHAQARRLRRSRARRASSGPTKSRPRSAARARAQARLQAHRHLRGGIRVVHAVSLRNLRAGVRGGPDAAAEGRDPRQRPEPDRAGHRVRLLLLPRGVCAARRGVRDRHGQLQPRDGVDRLRHRRSARTSSR